MPKGSELPAADTFGAGDEVIGLQAGVTKRFPAETITANVAGEVDAAFAVALAALIETLEE